VPFTHPLLVVLELELDEDEDANPELGGGDAICRSFYHWILIFVIEQTIAIYRIYRREQSERFINW